MLVPWRLIRFQCSGAFEPEVEEEADLKLLFTVSASGGGGGGGEE